MASSSLATRAAALGKMSSRLARGPAASQRSRTFLTAAAYNLAKKQMPKMSETEKIALGAGTVGFDRDIFGGSPSLKELVSTYTPKLSPEEQSFLDNEVEELCVLLDDHKVTCEKDMTAEAWEYMRWVASSSARPRQTRALAQLHAHPRSACASLPAVPRASSP